MSALARALKKRNPLDYVTGKALGDHLRSNAYPKPSTGNGAPIMIPGGRKRRGAGGYSKSGGAD